MRPLCALVRTRRCDSRVRQWFGHRLVPLQALVRVRVSMTVCERVSTSIYMCVCARACSSLQTRMVALAVTGLLHEGTVHSTTPLWGACTVLCQVLSFWSEFWSAHMLNCIQYAGTRISGKISSTN